MHLANTDLHPRGHHTQLLRAASMASIKKWTPADSSAAATGSAVTQPNGSGDGPALSIMLAAPSKAQQALRRVPTSRTDADVETIMRLMAGLHFFCRFSERHQRAVCKVGISRYLAPTWRVSSCLRLAWLSLLTLGTTTD